MKQKHFLTLSLFAFGALMIALLGPVGCSQGTADGPCSADYNCPADKPYCVGRQCIATLPVQENTQETAPSEPAAEKPATQDGGGQEAPVTKEDPPKGVCSTQKDCSESMPWCRFGRCAEGYVFFDFKAGHPVVEVSQENPPKTCTSPSQCPSWQNCYRTQSGNRCLTPPTKSQAKGKLKDEGIFMSGRSYSTIVLANAKESIRIVMVGEFSDKLQRELHIDIPKSLVRDGAKIDIEKNNLKVTMYDVKLEFVPPIRKVTAVGVRGTVNLTRGPTRYSTRSQPNTNMAGSADIVLKSP